MDNNFKDDADIEQIITQNEQLRLTYSSLIFRVNLKVIRALRKISNKQEMRSNSHSNIISNVRQENTHIYTRTFQRIKLPPSPLPIFSGKQQTTKIFQM